MLFVHGTMMKLSQYIYIRPSLSGMTTHDTIPDVAFLYALSRIPGVGNKTLVALLQHFGSGLATWKAVLDPQTDLPHIRPQALTALRTHTSTLDPTLLWNELSASGVSALAYTDSNFPPLLREIPDAPALLYIRGTYDWKSTAPFITIVGTRTPSNYGRQVVADFTRRLSSAGFTVISGLAFGIDSLAHQATLESGGHTLAVIGSGVDDHSISPQSHLRLAHDIVTRGGAVISELIPGTQATTGTFPARNRIMAGMSPITLVIEATEKSGTLITARLALEYNRDVYAIPGSIFTQGSIGCHRLIQHGAKLITSIEDILEDYPLTVSSTSSSDTQTDIQLDLPPDENRVFTYLTREPTHIDHIILHTKQSASEISTILTLLEMKGLAKNLGGMHYIRIC